MCRVPRCRGKTDADGVVFYGKEVCDSCYTKHCEGKIDLKKLFKIKEKAQEPKTEVVSKQLILAYKGKGGDESGV